MHMLININWSNARYERKNKNINKFFKKKYCNIQVLDTTPKREIFNEGIEDFLNFRRILNVVFLFWVISRCMHFMGRRFGMHCPFHFHRTSYEDGTERAHKIQRQGNHPKEWI